MKSIKIILSIVVVIVVLVAVAGFIRFNFMNGGDVLPDENTGKNVVERKYFGNEAYGDFDVDGKLDKVFLYTESGGGSGTFYYVTAVLDSKGKKVETNSILLGDRIAPQNTEFRDGNIIVNYADRGLDEPMTARPSIGVSKYLIISDGKLQEIEGFEMDPNTLPTAKTKCEGQGGIWNAEYSECGGISKGSCEMIGGTFNECASDCRHDPKAEVCNLMCVIICEMK